MCRLIAFALLAATAAAVIAIPAAANLAGTDVRIAFARFDPALDDDFVYTANADGSHERQLLPTGAERPRWSPDGTRIDVFPHDVAGVSARIVNPDDGTSRDLANPNADHLFLDCRVWSPDASRLACDGQSWDVDPMLNGIYTVRSSDGGGLQRLTSDPFGEDCPGDYSPNGKQLVFLRANDTTFALFTLKLDGKSDGKGDEDKGLRQITPNASDDFFINFDCGSWSPQGNEVLFSAHAPGDQRSTIWVVHADGKGLRQIPIPGCGGAISDPTTIGCFGPSWSPDGRKIVFVRRSAGQNDVYAVNADGTDLSLVSGTPHDEGGPPEWGTHPLLP